jgi:hypothetical protein
MYSRVVQATIRPKRIKEFRYAMNEHDLPIIRSQDGFAGDYVMYSGNKFFAITFWRTEKAAEHYATEIFPRLLARFEPLVLDIVRSETFRVESYAEMAAAEAWLHVMKAAPVRRLAGAAAA